MKILIIDIETAPNLAHVWGLWKQNIAVSQLIIPSYILCWAAKWVGKRKIYFQSIHNVSELQMLQEAHALLDEADVVMHFNGARFDVPTLNNGFIKHKLKPPSPYKQIDILKTTKARFRFPSNKLEYVARFLGLGGKIRHYGHQLWVDCMVGLDSAWRIMERYNKRDITLLEKVYDRVKPWIKGHPNYGLYGDGMVCTNCGSKNLNRRGYAYTVVSKYQRYQCKDCGHWVRGTGTEKRECKVLRSVAD